MDTRLSGLKIVEIGGAVAMPLAGMLLGSWGAEVIHVEPPGRGDMQRYMSQRLASWTQYSEINYLWEHVDRNKKSIAVNLASEDGQQVVRRIIASADVFVNNLRPYEMQKFGLEYERLAEINPRLIYANLTGYGTKGYQKNQGGYDSVAFWASSGVMDVMHEKDTPPVISRSGYGDSITSLSLLAGILGALYVREKTGEGQAVEVSLFNTGTWVLGMDISGCLITGKDATRPQRMKMSNPVRNHYPTKDGRWIMLGMTNSQHYWPNFCQAIERPDLEKAPKFIDAKSRDKNCEELIQIIEATFLSKNFAEWKEILEKNRVVWSPVKTPLEVTHDEQALANDFFLDWDHPDYGKIRVLNNPIKMSKTEARIEGKGPALGAHTDEVLKEAGYSEEEIRRMKESGAVE